MNGEIILMNRLEKVYGTGVGKNVRLKNDIRSARYNDKRLPDPDDLNNYICAGDNTAIFGEVINSKKEIYTGISNDGDEKAIWEIFKLNKEELENALNEKLQKKETQNPDLERLNITKHNYNKFEDKDYQPIKIKRTID